MFRSKVSVKRRQRSTLRSWATILINEREGHWTGKNCRDAEEISQCPGRHHAPDNPLRRRGSYKGTDLISRASVEDAITKERVEKRLQFEGIGFKVATYFNLLQQGQSLPGSRCPCVPIVYPSKCAETCTKPSLHPSRKSQRESKQRVKI